jgi:hypothetical protein
MIEKLFLFGGLAGVIFLFMQLVNHKEGIGQYLKDLFQKKKIDEISTINKQEQTVIKQIEDSELLSQETKEKVKTIKREANKQILDVLKTENFADLQKKESELW